jgi:Subtilase family
MMRWLAALLLLALLLPAAAAEVGADDPAQQVVVLLQMPPDHFRPDSGYSGSYSDGMGRSARRRVALQLADEHALRLLLDWPMPLLGADCYVMAVPEGRSPDQVAQALSGDRRVRSAQSMNLYRTQQHDDPLYAAQPAAAAWHLSELHRVATGRGVRVAVIDSAVDATHPDLAGQLVQQQDFVEQRPATAERHGTAVAGLIAARADDEVGIAGVAPQAGLMALRACWQQSDSATLCTSVSLAMALHHAISHRAAVINMSLSGPPDKLLAQLLDVALARGIVVVGAVDAALPGGGFPASHPGVIAVAADGPPSAVPGAVKAPAHDVPAPQPGGGWALLSGASYAAAQVSGLAALLRERGNGLASFVRLPGGEIDSCATLARTYGGCGCSCGLARRAAAGGGN